MFKKNNKCNHESEKGTRRIGRLGENGTSKMKKYHYFKKTLNQWIKKSYCILCIFTHMIIRETSKRKI